ncbi:MAG: M6 family metalloprotease domain-containing protein, partial [Candidatus Hodarchaeota archaeon]
MKKKAPLFGIFFTMVSLLSVLMIPITYTDPLPYRMLVRPYGQSITTEGRDYLPPMSINPSSYTGNKTLIVILLRFSDVSYSGGRDRNYYYNLLFNESNNASLQQYYWKNSYGRLNLTGYVTNWLTSSHTMSYYGADSGAFPNIDDDNGYIFEMAREAVELADPTVDFSVYDEDSDSFIDNLVIVHAGEGQEASHDSDDIWSHRWAIQPSETTDDGGVKASGYATLAEDSPIGVFAHEYGHLLNLPDFYDYTYSGPVFAGDWAVMDSGSWNGASGQQGTTPSHFISWSKLQLGFINATERLDVGLNEEKITTIVPTTDQTVAPGNHRVGVINISTGVYYTIEVRDQAPNTFDYYLPDSGVIISFCNDSARDEVFYGRPGAVVVQNAQPWDTSKDHAPFDLGGGEDWRFKDEERNIVVELIAKHSNGSYDVKLSYQQVEISNYYVNGSDIWQTDNGSSYALDVTLKNLGDNEINSVSGVLSTTEGGVTIDDNTVSYGTIPAGAEQNGTSNVTFNFTLGNIANTPYNFTLDVSFNSSLSSVFTIFLTVQHEIPPVNPNLTLISPINGSSYNASDEIVISGSASDDKGIFMAWARYKVLEDNYTSPWEEILYNGTHVSDVIQIKKIGNVSVTVRLMDTSGNINESMVTMEIVDEIDPIILFTVNGPENNPSRFAMLGNTLTVIAVVIDNGEVAAVNLSL